MAVTICASAALEPQRLWCNKVDLVPRDDLRRSITFCASPAARVCASLAGPRGENARAP